MKKREKMKNAIIVILCITIIFMGIGFMFLSMKLEGYKKDEETFDVRFTSVKMLSSLKGGEKDPVGEIEIEEDGSIINMNFRLFEEHDEVDYEVIVKNEGSVPASIIRLFASPDFRSAETIQKIAPLTISISDISGKILEPGEETSVKISAIYNPVPGGVAVPSEIPPLTGKIGIIASSKK